MPNTNTPKRIDYMADYYVNQPSLFRESENLHRVLQGVFDVFDEQQIDLLWLSNNILNVDLAKDFHLDFIGNLVGQTRFLSDFSAEMYFGFDRAYKSDTFSSVTSPQLGGYWNSRSYFNSATSRRLSDDMYRRLIKARVISNNSGCTSDDLLSVVNLLTNRTDSSIQMLEHGLISIKAIDDTGMLSYFIDRTQSLDNILPIAAGVRVVLSS